MTLVRVTLLALLVAAPAAAQDHTDVVAGVRQQLVARGVSLAGPCGAFEIVSRAAYILKDEGIGLFGGKSPAQNGCTVGAERYAVDILVTRDGCVVDVLINSETENRPAWQVLGCGGSASWRAPFARDVEPTPAPVPTPMPPPPPIAVPPPAPLPAVDLAPLLYRLDTLVEQLRALEVRLGALEASQEATRKDIADFRGAANNVLKNVVKYAGPAIAALFAGRMTK